MNTRSAALNVSSPYRSTSSTILLSPTRAAATPAHMSPCRKSGRRLFAFMISITERIGSPSEMSFTAGRRKPSWKICFASFEIEPGTMPPTSFQCAMFAVHATSSPSTNTGIASTTSLRCVTPP